METLPEGRPRLIHAISGAFYVIPLSACCGLTDSDRRQVVLMRSVFPDPAYIFSVIAGRYRENAVAVAVTGVWRVTEGRINRQDTRVPVAHLSQ